ncbi:hypothetical protein ACU6TU_00260 [Halomonas sp. LS-001]
MDLRNKESVVAWLTDGQPVMQSMVNKGKLLALVSQALEQDGHSVDQDTLSAIFIDPINDYEQATGNSAGDPRNQRILPTMVYLYYADWGISYHQANGSSVCRHTARLDGVSPEYRKSD